MKKYISVFKISFQQEFAYRINFLMWRMRNVFQIFLVFFLWDTIFSDPSREIFGYDRARILTYVFGLLIIKAFVFSARTMDVAGEIARGDLGNYLVKPVSYFKYWLTRDVSSKVLNLMFAAVETSLLYLILKPPFFLQTNFMSLLGFVLAVGFAILIYFTALFITSSVPFWMPEAAWGVHFLVTVIIIEFMSGALFPLDILPGNIQAILNYTPFPYLIYFPLQVYLGKIVGVELFRGLATSAFWMMAMWALMNYVWRKGLRVFQAHGR